MVILHNSIWQSVQDASLPIGLYRALYVEEMSDLIILFQIKELKSLSKPFAISFESFTAEIANKHVESSRFNLPIDFSKPDVELPAAWIKKRDDNYELIKGIVEDIYCLLDFATNKKSRVIHQHIMGLADPKPDRKKMARLLSLYWT